MKNKINFILFFSTIVLVTFTSLICSCESEQSQYLVELTYCDQRGKDTVVLTRHFPVGNENILTYERAVPIIYEDGLSGNTRKYLNVCNVKTLKKL